MKNKTKEKQKTFKLKRSWNDQLRINAKNSSCIRSAFNVIQPKKLKPAMAFSEAIQGPEKMCYATLVVVDL